VTVAFLRRVQIFLLTYLLTVPYVLYCLVSLQLWSFFLLRGMSLSSQESSLPFSTASEVATLWRYRNVCIIRSTPPSRPNTVGLKCPSARPYVLPSVRPKRFFDFNEIWYVGRGLRVMHDGIQYDPIQG